MTARILVDDLLPNLKLLKKLERYFRSKAAEALEALECIAADPLDIVLRTYDAGDGWERSPQDQGESDWPILVVMVTLYPIVKIGSEGSKPAPTIFLQTS